jgi:hypothetical protein
VLGRASTTMRILFSPGSGIWRRRKKTTEKRQTSSGESGFLELSVSSRSLVQVVVKVRHHGNIQEYSSVLFVRKAEPPNQDILEFPSACESHNVLRIILLPDPTKPLQMFTIHPLYWCSEQCIVDIRRCVLQVLPILNRSLDQRCSRKTHSVRHEYVG